KHGEMALAYAVDYIESKRSLKITNYGEFLEKNPPTHEVQIYENTSWSCVHGVERWRSNCGCNSGRPGWNQEWRKPLREALDWLRDSINPNFECLGSKFLRDPWAARDSYIDVVLNRSPEVRQRFAEEHFARELDPKEQVLVWKLMELQRHAMLMYTSCGWFFDELSGIETVQVIQYAGRAIQLAQETLGQDFEPAFLERLEKAPSNVPEHGNGRAIYNKFVKPAMIDWQKVVAHYAISSMFENYAEQTKVYLYHVQGGPRQLAEAGKARLAIGTV